VEELDQAQALLKRARCLFDYTQPDHRCSPYAGILYELRKRTAAWLDTTSEGWSLPAASALTLGRVPGSAPTTPGQG
jgi:hypothetical protein